MFLCREEAAYLDCTAPNITLVTRRGLGDTLVCLPTLYALQARGHGVDLRCEGPGPQWGHLLPLPIPLHQEAEFQTLDVTQSRLFYWSGTYPLVDTVAQTCGLDLAERETPRAPWLPKPEPYLEPGSYVLVCPQGSTGHRCLHPGLQNGALQGTPPELETVFIHTHPLPVEPGSRDLTGQTTVEQYFALVAHAAAVVACDGGSLHLAAAFGTPLVAAVAPRTINPHALARDWQPSWWISADYTSHITGEAVRAALVAVLETEPGAVVRKKTGPAWWQSARVQSRMATAAEHQRGIDETCARYTTAAA